MHRSALTIRGTTPPADPDTLPDSSDPSGPCPRCGRISNFTIHPNTFPLLFSNGWAEQAVMLTCMGCQRTTVVIEQRTGGRLGGRPLVAGPRCWAPSRLFEDDRCDHDPGHRHRSSPHLSGCERCRETPANYVVNSDTLAGSTFWNVENTWPAPTSSVKAEQKAPRRSRRR